MLAATACCAQAAPDAQFVPAFQSFLRASEGQDAALASALAGFETLSRAEPASPVLIQASEGQLPENDFCVVLATNRIAFACSPARDGLSLRVFSAFRLRPPPVARLLVASFSTGNRRRCRN